MPPNVTGNTSPLPEAVLPQLPKPDHWAHRSSSMLCGKCMYFVRKEINFLTPPGYNYLGRCRRNAPTMSGWPAVFEGDWCGNHKLDENKI